MSFVDIRDVSMAHLRAIKVQEAANERFLISCSDAWLRDVILPLGPQFPKLTGIPKNQVTGLDKERGYKCDNTKSKEKLGMEYIDLQTTFRDMTNSMVERGLVQKKEEEKKEEEKKK